MGVLSKGTDFTNGDQVTDTSLDNLVDNATFTTSAVDLVSTDLGGSGSIIVRDGGITTAKLADSVSAATGVTAVKIASSAVTTVKILDANVTEAKIATGAVTVNKLGTNAVTTVKIADANVTTAKIADNAVTETKVLDGSITPAKLSTGAPTWTTSGALGVGVIYGPEANDSLILRADPESPDPTTGGAQIQLYSADEATSPSQINYRANYHVFNNQAGTQVASIPISTTPTAAQHLVRKDYVDGTSSFTTEDGQSAGYQVFPSGLKMAWGDSTAGLDGVITFPSGVGFTVAPTVQISYNKATTSDDYLGAQVGDVSTTNFEYKGSYANLHGPRYLAIGI
jgi:hypothetical protein